jgi:30S ribosomal protein S31
MGRGDKRTRKGKIFIGSSGNSRSKKKKIVTSLSQPDATKAKSGPKKPKPEMKKPALKKETAPKKTAAKKPVEKKETPKAE